MANLTALIEACPPGHRHRTASAAQAMEYPKGLALKLRRMIVANLVRAGTLDEGAGGGLFRLPPRAEEEIPEAPAEVEDSPAAAPEETAASAQRIVLQSGDEAVVEGDQGGEPGVEDADPVWVRPTGLNGWWCVDHPHPRQEMFVPPLLDTAARDPGV